ncbi:MAG: LmeA family phospholipid-binding protein [Candidatus Aquicultorales bacterium]
MFKRTAIILSVIVVLAIGPLAALGAVATAKKAVARSFESALRREYGLAGPLKTEVDASVLALVGGRVDSVRADGGPVSVEGLAARRVVMRFEGIRFDLATLLGGDAKMRDVDKARIVFSLDEQDVNDLIEKKTASSARVRIDGDELTATASVLGRRVGLEVKPVIDGDRIQLRPVYLSSVFKGVSVEVPTELLPYGMRVRAIEVKDDLVVVEARN